MQRSLFTIFISLLFCTACWKSAPKQSTRWKEQMEQMAPLYPLKSADRPGDWLTEHKETYQSFESYMQRNPTHLDTGANKIYIALIHLHSPAQKRIIALTIDYLRAFYQLPVVELVIDDKITDFYRQSRTSLTGTNTQLSARYLMDSVLTKNFPKDAAVLLGFTDFDLYPSPDWNYVFGLSSAENKVGIWSIYRFGDPEKDFETCFSSTLKVATHETGHLFALPHCIKYECCMNGVNNLSELQSRPTRFCPDCLIKLCWYLDQDPQKKLRETLRFWQSQNNQNEIVFYRNVLTALQTN